MEAWLVFAIFESRVGYNILHTTLTNRCARRQNCMSSLDPHSHSRRRRRVMQPYLKGQLQTSKQLHSIMVTVLRDRLSPRLLPSLNSNVVVVNAMSLCFATVMDVVSGYAFGLDTALDLTGNPKKCLSYQKLYREASAQTWMFWAQELPVVSRFFPSTTQTRKARSFLEADVLSMCTSVEDNRSESTDCSEFDSLQRASLQHFSGGEDDREGFASEMLDHLKATSDVLSVTLAQALYELSKNQLAQLQLRSELQGLCGLQNWETRWLPSAMDLDALPFLDAVVCEALRLRPTLPDGQPRVSLPTGVNLLGVHVPANVRISMYPYIMHHDGTIFTDPYIWNPHRWMSTEIDRNMHLWAFGVGARACLGKHMTMLGQSIWCMDRSLSI
jgi:cytochrome P450